MEDGICRIEDKIDDIILPCGATLNVYLRVVDNDNHNFYYSDNHTTQNGFQIARSQLEPLFLELFKFFEKYCNFPRNN